MEFLYKSEIFIIKWLQNIILEFFKRILTDKIKFSKFQCKYLDNSKIAQTRFFCEI